VRPDVQVVTGNLSQGTAWAAEGARLYLLQISAGRPRVLVRSRRGRWVNRWVSLRGIRDLRMKTIPPEHPLYESLRYLALTEETIDALVERCPDNTDLDGRTRAAEDA
jgi:hypothetical protein